MLVNLHGVGPYRSLNVYLQASIELSKKQDDVGGVICLGKLGEDPCYTGLAQAHKHVPCTWLGQLYCMSRFVSFVHQFVNRSRHIL